MDQKPQKPIQMDLIPEVRRGIDKHYRNASFLRKQVQKILEKNLCDCLEVRLYKNVLKLTYIVRIINCEDLFYEFDLRQDKNRPEDFTLVLVGAGPHAVVFDNSEEVVDILKNEIEKSVGSDEIKDLDGNEVKIKLDSKIEFQD